MRCLIPSFWSSPFGQFPPRYERLRPQAPPRILNPHYDPSGTHYDWLLPPQPASSSSPWGCGSNLHVDDVQLIWCVMMGKLQEVDPFPRLIGGQGHSGIVCKNYPRFEQWRWRWLTKGDAQMKRTWLVMRLAMCTVVRSHTQCDERRDITKV